MRRWAGTRIAESPLGTVQPSVLSLFGLYQLRLLMSRVLLEAQMSQALTDVRSSPIGARHGHVLIRHQLHVVALQTLSPEPFPICIDSRRKKFTWIGRLTWRRIAASSLRISSRLNKAQGSEPRPPACETATTISEKTHPAMGAWIIGSWIPKSSRMRLFGHIITAQ